jgi:hypothetical protein
MNRIKQYLEEPEERPPEGDYFVIDWYGGVSYVSAETARSIEKQLDRIWVPRWITFHDLSGSRCRLHSRLIQSISESTAEQRTRERTFARALRQEEKADRRPWEEDD